MMMKEGVIDTPLKWFEAGFYIEIDNIKEHIKILEKLLKDELKNFQKRIDAQAIDIPEKEREAFYEWYSDDYWRRKEVLPQLQRNSTFLLIYNFLEDQLNIVCRMCANKSDCKLTLKDIYGGGIEKAKTYLEKVIGIDFPSGTKEWNEIKKFNQIRNIIVHNGGKIEKNQNKKKIVNIIKNNELLDLDQFNKIQIYEGFNLSSIEIISKFFGILFHQLKDFNIGNNN